MSIRGRYLVHIAKRQGVYCSYEGNGVYLIIHNGIQLRGYAKACLRYILKPRIKPRISKGGSKMVHILAFEKEDQYEALAFIEYPGKVEEARAKAEKKKEELEAEGFNVFHFLSGEKTCYTEGFTGE